MKLVAWFVLAVLGSAACSEPSRTSPDAKPPEQGPPIGFTFEAVGDRSFASFGWTGMLCESLSASRRSTFSESR